MEVCSPYADPVALVDRVARSVWHTPPTLRVSAWAAAHRMITGRGDAYAGPWKNTKTPYLVEIMDACDTPGVDAVTFMKSSQVGGTEALIINVIGSFVAQSPGPCLAIWPNQQLAAKTIKRRIIPTFKASGLGQNLHEARGDTTTTTIRFDSMDLYAAGSGGATNLRSTAIRRVFIDEFELCDPSTLEEAFQRTASFSSDGPRPPLVVCLGTPGEHGRGLHARYLRGDQRRFLIPCPACGHYHEPAFENLRWRGGIEADPAAVERDATLQCPQCKAAIASREKAWMLARGGWAPEGVAASADIHALRRYTPSDASVGRFPPCVTLSGTPVSVVTNHRSYRIGGLCSPFKPFGWTARGLIESKGEPPPQWRNGVLGLPSKPHGRSLDLVVLKAQRDAAADGAAPHEPYPMGVVPHRLETHAPIVCLVGGLDVQSDGVYFVVEAMTRFGRDTLLIDAGFVEAPREQGLSVVGGLLSHRYPGTGPRGEEGTYGVSIWAIDTGYRTHEVYDLCRLSPGRLFAVKGDHAGARPVTSTVIDAFPDGSPIPGGLSLTLVNGHYWAEVLYAQIARSSPAGPSPAGAPSPLSVALDGRRYWPRNLPDHLLRQYESERADGQRYVLKDGRRDNHLADCSKYIQAIATLHGVRRLAEPVGFVPSSLSPPTPSPTPSPPPNASPSSTHSPTRQPPRPPTSQPRAVPLLPTVPILTPTSAT